MNTYIIGQFVEFGYNNGSVTVKHQGKIVTADNLTSGYEYDIMDENYKILYKHIPEEYIYRVVDGIDNCINENTRFYCLTLDDYATPSFCSFGKDYFGSLPLIASLIESLEADERYANNHTRLIQAFKEYRNGKTEVTHSVAYRETLLLEPVYIYAEMKSTTGCNKVKHLNVWDCIYYMRWEKAESDHIWLRHKNSYVRCIKTKFHKLEYSGVDADKEYRAIKYCMGFPMQIVLGEDFLENRLYVTEKVFDNEEELLKDIENFRNAPGPIYTEIFNDIFGDG